MHLDEQLFRREWGRILPALTRIFGLDHLAVAEDVLQDVFCRALEVWKLRGIPENPSAWLMKAAKNRAIDVLRRERTARTYVPELQRLLESEWTMVATVDGFFDAETIRDDELRLAFTCCDPGISEDARVAVTLNLVAGFSAAEIAAAFLSKPATIEKRIERAKAALARRKRLFDLSDRDLPVRLSAVHRTLYLLFNEGYHGASKHGAVRAELCREAMRLGALLARTPAVCTPATLALCALMSLNAARLPARMSAEGDLLVLAEQDRSRWDARAIARGNEFLERSATGGELSEYHVEAAIAAAHSNAPSTERTDWPHVVWLYDTLYAMRPTPIVALNRAIAAAQIEGPASGIERILAIEGRDKLASYPFFFAALGDLASRAGRADEARSHFARAASLARNANERRFLTARAGGSPPAGS